MKQSLFVFGAVLGLLGTSVLAHADRGGQVGDTAPDFTLETIVWDGEASSTVAAKSILERQDANQYLILEFFMTTCGPCNENLPIVSNLTTEVQGAAEVRLVGIDRRVNVIQSYVESKVDFVRFDVAMDTRRQATRAYEIQYVPTIFVIAPNNEIVYRHTGVLGATQLNAIRGLIGLN